MQNIFTPYTALQNSVPPTPLQDVLTCCTLEPATGGSRALVGTLGHEVQTYDLLTGRDVGTTPVGSEPIALMSAPLGRGMVVLGTGMGKIQVADPRAKMKVSEL